MFPCWEHLKLNMCNSDWWNNNDMICVKGSKPWTFKPQYHQMLDLLYPSFILYATICFQNLFFLRQQPFSYSYGFCLSPSGIFLDLLFLCSIFFLLKYFYIAFFLVLQHFFVLFRIFFTDYLPLTR